MIAQRMADWADPDSRGLVEEPNSRPALAFGMPTLIDLEGLEPNFELCERLGLDFIELNMNLPAYQPDRIDRAFVKRRAAAGTFFTLHLPEELDLGQFNAAIREAHVSTLLTSLDMCDEMGIGKMNMHMSSGVYFTLPEARVYLYERYGGEYLKNLRSSLEAIAPRLEATGIELLVENSGIFGMGFVKEGVDLMLECPLIGLTWDVGHDHASGRADRPFIDGRADRVRHMHLHDARGAGDHLPLFSGEIDLAEALEFASSRRCGCVVEAKTVRGLEISIEALKARKFFSRRTP